MKKIKTVKVSEGCIGCGTCQAVCPEVFEVNAVSIVKNDVNLQAHKDSILEAADMCPVGVIEVAFEDEQGE